MCTNIHTNMHTYTHTVHKTISGNQASRGHTPGLKTMGFTRYSDHASCKRHNNLLYFVKALDFRGEIKKLFDVYNFTRHIT